MVKHKNIYGLLSALTIIFVLVQIYLFIAHYKVSDLVDSLVGTSIALQLLHPVILLPIFGFFLLQAAAYAVFVSWIGFVTLSVSEWFLLSNRSTLLLAMCYWAMAVFVLLTLNHYYFPDSLFAKLLTPLYYDQYIAMILLSMLLVLTLFAYVNFFWFKQYKWSGSIVLFVIVMLLLPAVFTQKFVRTNIQAKPNIIVIGLDSLRPDFTGFYGNQTVATPNIDHYLATAISFSESYTPLARTFPAWMSILTAKYPKHSEARNNLIAPELVMDNEMLSRRLQQAGYVTIYATDEKRFSNITKDYGFDRVLGPKMGVNDFLLGGLSDFPLSNLLINLPAGRFLFPYNYGNRAAHITYQPNSFLELVKSGLANLPEQPVFLAVHLCLAHWPSTWADKNHVASPYLSRQYARSVNALDKQFGALMQLLKERGLLANSWVVIVSDHGTALGLPHDRIIAEENYQGDKRNMKMVVKYKLSALSKQKSKPVYTISTAYGQGTNILSLTQNHVLLAFKQNDANVAKRTVNSLASLLDVAPTLLDVAGLAPLSAVDGLSLRQYFSGNNKAPLSRPFFMETGDTLSEIETDHIYIEQVIKHKIGLYGIAKETGLLSMTLRATQAINQYKQQAVLKDDWILAHFPPRLQHKKIMPAYYVLANKKTGQWTIELDSSFAKSAPLQVLRQRLRDFYGNELQYLVPPDKFR